MTDAPSCSPGTVSRILWHFTGGPDWDSERRMQKKSRKPTARAYRNLKSIIRTKEVHLGQYQEAVSVIVPRRRKFNVKTRRTEIEENVRLTLTSVPTCCLSDIPIQHLHYHANRYGPFAIGFHRAAAVREGFNPVLYTLEHTSIIQSIYGGLSELDFVEPEIISNGLDEIESSLKTIESKLGENNVQTELGDLRGKVLSLQPEAEGIKNSVKQGCESLRRLLAFVKTFSEDEFSTIYCEREWRSLRAFQFSMDDVAMIVVPRLVGSPSYFEDFVNEVVSTLRIPPTIPVVPWEDLVEQ